MWQKIDQLLDKQTRKYGVYNQAEASRICFEAQKIYKDLFRPLSFKNGVLTILVKNSIKAQEIQLQSHKIIEKINKKIGSPAVKRLKFRVEE